jgi:hypothetical protein
MNLLPIYNNDPELYTWKSSKNKTYIDYFIISKNLKIDNF